jgi:excisionase family DNA binding protein
MDKEKPELPPLAHSVEDTYRSLGISRAMFYKLAKAGEIHTIKIGTRTLVPESERQRFIADKLAESQQVAA